MEINPSIRIIHRREDLYPDAGAFRPERFLVDDPPDTYTWIPFGGGTRRCLGASFALMEMRLVLARVLERTALRAAHPIWRASSSARSRWRPGTGCGSSRTACRHLHSLPIDRPPAVTGRDGSRIQSDQEPTYERAAISRRLERQHLGAPVTPDPQ